MAKERPPHRPKASSRLLAPFVWSNWALAWVSYLLSRLAIFKVLEYAGKLTILSATILWIAGASDRDKADQRTAWSVVNAKGGGRREALETSLQPRGQSSRPKWRSSLFWRHRLAQRRSTMGRFLLSGYSQRRTRAL
jgi:hypothetical protein